MIPASLAKSVTLYAGFDNGTDAATARGDKRLYNAPSYKEQDKATPGFGGVPVEVARKEGLRGDALRFTKKNTHALFYKGRDNVAYRSSNWSGTVSFWLRLDPERDLAPGFCDPIQITDKAYNDSAIWVDFTKDEKPRHFRLGIFGDLKSWNPKNIEPDKNPVFMKRLSRGRKAAVYAGALDPCRRNVVRLERDQSASEPLSERRSGWYCGEHQRAVPVGFIPRGGSARSKLRRLI